MNVSHGEVLNEQGECCVLLTRMMNKQADLHRLGISTTGALIPRFSWKGFQYAQVSFTAGGAFRSNNRSNLLKAVTGLQTNMDLEDSTFQAIGASNAVTVLNGIASIVKNSQLGNLAAYHPTDCPTREKHGWLGDSLNTAENLAMSLFAPGMFTNWLRTIQDDQVTDKSENLYGRVPSVAPQNTMFGDISWMAAYPVEVDMMLSHYDDLRPVVEHWTSVRLFMDELMKEGDADHKACAKNSCPVEAGGLPDFWTWGDWCAVEPRSVHTPNTGAPLAALNFIGALDAMVRMATALEDSSAVKTYSEARVRYAKVFLERFYDSSTHTFNADTSDPMTVQSIGAAALNIGVVPEEQILSVVNALTDDVAARGINVGSIGSQHLLAALARHGANSVAGALATTTDYPSWGHWVELNATTCWESWSGEPDCMHSGSGPNCTGNPPTHNHIFLCGGVGEYLYKDIVGISPSEPGYKVTTISPRSPLPNGVDGAKASVKTVRGPIEAEWHLSDEEFSLKASVPVHVAARIIVPLLGNSISQTVVSVDDNGSRLSVFANGNCITSDDPVSAWGLTCEAASDAIVFGVASGEYQFRMLLSSSLYV